MAPDYYLDALKAGAAAAAAAAAVSARYACWRVCGIASSVKSRAVDHRTASWRETASWIAGARQQHDHHFREDFAENASNVTCAATKLQTRSFILGG